MLVSRPTKVSLWVDFPASDAQNRIENFTEHEHHFCSSVNFGLQQFYCCCFNTVQEFIMRAMIEEQGLAHFLVVSLDDRLHVTLICCAVKIIGAFRVNLSSITC